MYIEFARFAFVSIQISQMQIIITHLKLWVTKTPLQMGEHFNSIPSTIKVDMLSIGIYY